MSSILAGVAFAWGIIIGLFGLWLVLDGVVRMDPERIQKK